MSDNPAPTDFDTLIRRHRHTLVGILGEGLGEPSPAEFAEYVRKAAKVLTEAWCRDNTDMLAAHAHLAAAAQRSHHPASQRKLLKLAATRLDQYRPGDYLA
ncbi:hypothetical protein ACWGIR_23240 [Streptomyces albidoflavus]